MHTFRHQCLLWLIVSISFLPMASALMKQSRLTISNTVFMICDQQEKFRPLIHRSSTIIQKTCFLNTAFDILDIPCIIAEQYPQALGRTFPEIVKFPNTKLFEKKTFSMLGNEDLAKELADSGRKQVVMCGLEAHVCVLQSTLDLLDCGYEVHLVCDAVSSQRPHDRAVALSRMQASGVVLTTAEAVVFDLMRTKDHPRFRDISTLLKAHNHETVNEFAGDTSL